MARTDYEVELNSLIEARLQEFETAILKALSKKSVPPL